MRHRIFYPLTIVNELLPDLELYEFSYTDVPNTRIVTCFKCGKDISILDYVTRNELGEFMFGLFTFKKFYKTR